MAYAPTVPAPRAALAPTTSAPTSVQPARPFWRRLWRRLYVGMIRARRRQADREIARYLQSVGGTLTDHAEREIERRYLPY